MKSVFTLFLLAALPVIALSQNLIGNPDFESNGQLRCDSWHDACHQELLYLCDSLLPGNPCDVRFIEEAPGPGGSWSMAVTGVGNSPASTASTYITGQHGTNIYQLNAWMKDDGNGWGGINIGTHRKGKYELSKTLRADSVTWAFFTAADTLSLEPEDSIEITLWAFAAGPFFGDIAFDQLELVVTDTLSSGLTIVPDRSTHVRVFPNPSSRWVTFAIDDYATSHTLTVVKITGEPVLMLSGADRIFCVDLARWGSGMYVYTVTASDTHRTIDQGICLIR